MTKLRDDLRDAFDQEQTRLGDVRDARHRLMREAMAARDVSASRGLQRAAGVAAVLIAAIVIATFVLAKAGTQWHGIPAATPTPSPKASVSPTPLSRELTVPDSTPVIVYHDPAKFDQIDGITWDGKLSGKITGGSVAIGNPANSLFGQGGQIIDRHGKVVATGTYGAKFWTATWADDETHFCLMTPFDNPGAAGIPTSLELGTPGQPLKAIARVGTLYNQTSVYVLACSVLGDRAVVVQSGGQGVGVAQYWVVQMSTGKVLWTRTLDLNGLPVQLCASRDGQFVAEDQGGNATIYGPDGNVAATLQETVDLFSWDGSLVLTSVDTNALRILRWRDSHLVWSGPTTDSNASFFDGMAEPDGNRIALEVRNPTYGAGADSTGLTPIDVLVISADGTVVFELRHVYVNG